MTQQIKFGAAVALVLCAWWAAQPRAQHAAADTGQSREVANVRGFLETHCYTCHNGQTQKGKLDLTALKPDFNDAGLFAVWVKVHDRVRDGEMPPKGLPRPPEAARAAFLKTLAVPMIAADTARARREGRAVLRRMNRYEYENTLRDLLQAPWLQVKDMLPEDGEAHRFNKVGEALDVSHVQMSRYLAAAEYALREVMAHEAARPASATQRYYAREQNAFARRVVYTQFNRHPERATFPLIGNEADVPALEQKAPMTVGEKDPARRELEAMGVTVSTYEPLEIKFDKFKAPLAGRYKVRINAYSFWAGAGRALVESEPPQPICRSHA